MTDQELQALLQSMVYQRGGYTEPLPQETRPEPMQNQINPALQQYAAQIFQGGQENQFSPLGLTGGGAAYNAGNAKGMGYGGRLSADLPLSEQQLLNLGVSGMASDVTYGMGTPYQGRSARSDITGIDATLRDLARNQEFGASYAKDPIKNNPFYSLFYRKFF